MCCATWTPAWCRWWASPRPTSRRRRSPTTSPPTCDAAGRRLSEPAHRPGLPGLGLVRDRGPDLAVTARPGRSANTGGRLTRDQFSIDFAAGKLTCPAGVACQSSPARPCGSPRTPAPPARCGNAARRSPSGRSVAIHPDEALLAELRHASRPRPGEPSCATRPGGTHPRPHRHWQGRRARYRGTRKNLFDLRRIAVVHDLHVIARHPPADGYELAA